jgi:hypothetical protein
MTNCTATLACGQSTCDTWSKGEKKERPCNGESRLLAQLWGGYRNGCIAGSVVLRPAIMQTSVSCHCNCNRDAHAPESEEKNETASGQNCLVQ